MELAQDKIDLIGKIIKEDRKYLNNEDLYEDFLNETCKRSLSIINAIDNESTLTAYLRRIATTSIIAVLKDAGRLKRTKSGYMSTGEVAFSPKSADVDIDYSSIDINYANLKIPQTPEEIVIQNDILESVSLAVRKFDSEEPEKKYLPIYTMRYNKGMTQKEISEELSISQSEVSKRLYKLMTKVKDIFK